MRIEELEIHQFRNIERAKLESDSQFVVLQGINGAGKTSILEAVYVLSTLRSFRESSPDNLIRWDHPSSRITASMRTDLGKQRLVWGIHRGQRGRLLQLDGKNINRLGTWFGRIRSILFCPEHIHIVRGSAEIRRQFLDRARFTAHPEYLKLVQQYQRILKQKRELLKQDTVLAEELRPWNEQLIDTGTTITIQRQLILEELAEPFQLMHQYLSGKERVELKLKGIGGTDRENIRARLEELVFRAWDSEVKRKQVLVGPHLDDLVILMEGRPARKFASQGQTRSIVIALKMAELEAARNRGDRPIFLLDDLSSELDQARTQRLVQMLSERDSQVWISSTSSNQLGRLPESRVSKYEVDSGMLRKLH